MTAPHNYTLEGRTEDFLDRITIDPVTQCWLYSEQPCYHYTTRLHIGSFKISMKKKVKGHVASWYLFKEQVLHKYSHVIQTCGQTHCVNPAHLAKFEDRPEITPVELSIAAQKQVKKRKVNATTPRRYKPAVECNYDADTIATIQRLIASGKPPNTIVDWTVLEKEEYLDRMLGLQPGESIPLDKRTLEYINSVKQANG